jgi:ribosomal RNA-processing protein 36
MALSNKLDRKLRAAEESSDDSENYEVTDRSSSESVLDTGAGGDIMSSDDDDDADQDEEMVRSRRPYYSTITDSAQSDVSNDDKVQAQMSKVSFGALAKAHDALAKDQSGDRKRKRGEPSSQAQEDKLEALRARLRQIKADKMAAGAIDPSTSKSKSKSAKPAEKSQQTKHHADPGSDSDSDAAPHARSSKHAPAVQSSKRMVSRKRNVVDVKKPTFRDPRFDAATGPRPDDNTLNKRYAFLNDYKASEIADLKRTIKKSKSEGEKEQLKKQLLSMESQQKARENKEQHQAVIRDHKKKEKELVKDGKKPFFLKKCMSAPRTNIAPANPTHSRAEEARPHRQVPEHEGKAARQDHRAPSQEGHVQGAPQHACRATDCMSSRRYPFLGSPVGTGRAASRSNFTLSYRYPLSPCVLEQRSASRGIPLIRHIFLSLLLQCAEGVDTKFILFPTCCTLVFLFVHMQR